MGSIVKVVINYGSEKDVGEREQLKAHILSHLDPFLFPEEFGLPEHYGNTLIFKSYMGAGAAEKLVETLEAVSADGYVQVFLSMPEFSEEATIEFVNGLRTYERRFSLT